MAPLTDIPVAYQLTTLQPTKATHDAYYLHDEQSPTIVLSLTVSPQYSASDESVKLPALQRLSDIVFLTYYTFWRRFADQSQIHTAGGSKIPAPKYIFIKDIQEEDAIDTFFPEIGKRGRHPPYNPEGQSESDSGDESDTKPLYFGDWPGVTFAPQQDEFWAMLATRQGRGISAFLFNHKQELGPRRIKGITIWHSGEELSYFMRFEMEDSPVPLMKRSPTAEDQSIAAVQVYTSGLTPVKRRDSFDLEDPTVGGLLGGVTREY